MKIHSNSYLRTERMRYTDIHRHKADVPDVRAPLFCLLPHPDRLWKTDEWMDISKYAHMCLSLQYLWIRLIYYHVLLYNVLDASVLHMQVKYPRTPLKPSVCVPTNADWWFCFGHCPDLSMCLIKLLFNHAVIKRSRWLFASCRCLQNKPGMNGVSQWTFLVSQLLCSSLHM